MIYGTSLQLTETSPPTDEPVSLAEIKKHCRVDIDDDDLLLSGMVTAARQHIEERNGLALCDRTYRLDLPVFDPEIILPRPPLASVSNIKYYDTANNLQTLNSSNYEVDLPGGRILLSATGSYPATYNRHDAIQITFVAGYGTTDSPAGTVDERVKVAICLIVGDLYENREASITGTIHKINPTLDALLGPTRMRL